MVDTDLNMYYMRLRRDNQLRRHTDAHLQRERSIKAMRASVAYRNLEIQRGALQESTRGLPIDMQRYYSDMIKTMSDRMTGIEGQYPDLSREIIA